MPRKGVKHAGWRQIGRGRWVTTGRQARRSAKRRAFRAGYDRTAGYYGRTGRTAWGGPGPELKFHDIDINDASVASGGNIAEDSCVTIPQGVTEVQRLARLCTVKSINWRFTVNLLANASVGVGDTLRVILYLDKQCNGVAATVTGILESDDYQSFNNLANKSRFRTLMDRTYDVNVMNGAGDGTSNDHASTVHNDTFFHKCDIPLEYDSTTGAITELRSNNIGVLLLSNTGARVGFESKMRIRFVG